MGKQGWDEIERRKQEINSLFNNAITELPVSEGEQAGDLGSAIKSSQETLLKQLDNASYLSDGLCREEEWALEACKQFSEFAETLVATILVMKNPEATPETKSAELQRLKNVAAGGLIPPKVKRAIKCTILPNLAFLGGLSMLWGFTPAAAAIIASGPVGIGILGAILFGAAALLACCTYNTGRGAERAQATTDMRQSKMKLADKLSDCSIFSTPNQAKDGDVELIESIGDSLKPVTLK